MEFDADVLVVGAGPAGAASAILLAQAGWRVLLLEQQVYPRDKVCGECVSAGSLGILDALGVGAQFRQRSGPELRWLGWMNATSTVMAAMPACAGGDYRFSHAMGRHCLDALLVERARELGVVVIQPARLRHIAGGPGGFQCVYQTCGATPVLQTVRVPLVVDAHGSCERGAGEWVEEFGAGKHLRAPCLPGDLLAFKASFRNAELAGGYLPLIALRGGYAGMVVAEGGRTTLACCVRRDLLKRCRKLAPGKSAGEALETYLRDSAWGVRDALASAEREGSWLSVGPVKPGIKRAARDGVFRVGNAAGETHPLVGEGIGMALQSAQLLAHHLTRSTSGLADTCGILEVQRNYVRAWRREFAGRIELAAIFARIAMSAALAAPAGRLLRHRPALLTLAARLAGKARAPVSIGSTTRNFG